MHEHNLELIMPELQCFSNVLICSFFTVFLSVLYALHRLLALTTSMDLFQHAKMNWSVARTEFLHTDWASQLSRLIIVGHWLLRQFTSWLVVFLFSEHDNDVHVGMSFFMFYDFSSYMNYDVKYQSFFVQSQLLLNRFFWTRSQLLKYVPELIFPSPMCWKLLCPLK